MDTLKNIILNDPFFAEEHTSNEDYDSMALLLAKLRIARPEFVQFTEKPKPRTVRLADNGKFTVEGEDGQYDSVEVLYDATTGPLHFDDSVAGSPEVEHKMDQFLFLRSEGGSARLLLGRDSDDAERAVAYAYYQFLVAARQWYKNPDDFFTSYDFLIRHPAFWHVHKSSNPVMEDEWVTDDGLSDMTVYTYKSEEDGKRFVGLEAGGVVRPDNIRFWRGDGLNVTKPTLDEAYIALASALDSEYDLTGTHRKKPSEG